MYDSLSAEYLYRVMKFNNCSIPEEVNKTGAETCQRSQKCSIKQPRLSLCCSSGLVHDSLPFLLPLALARRLHAPVQPQRPEHAALGPGVQVSVLSSVAHAPGSSRHLTLHLFFSLHSKFDLYTKTMEMPDVEKLKPYYQSLIDKYCPGILKWWNPDNSDYQYSLLISRFSSTCWNLCSSNPTCNIFLIPHN